MLLLGKPSVIYQVYEHIGNFPIIKVQAFVRLMMNPISHHLCVYHLIDPNGFIRVTL